MAGEVVFNTGMVGYPEALTDPSCKPTVQYDAPIVPILLHHYITLLSLLLLALFLSCLLLFFFRSFLFLRFFPYFLSPLPILPIPSFPYFLCLL